MRTIVVAAFAAVLANLPVSAPAQPSITAEVNRLVIQPCIFMNIRDQAQSLGLSDAEAHDYGLKHIVPMPMWVTLLQEIRESAQGHSRDKRLTIYATYFRACAEAILRTWPQHYTIK